MLRYWLLLIAATVSFAIVPVFSQTAEPGKSFNRFMSPQAGLNMLSGTVAFSKSLVQISSGGVAASFDLAYSGNVFRETQTRNDKSPGSWVGLGWALGRASIICDHRGTIVPDDDMYYLSLPTGVRYQLIYASGRWWAEQQPYWKIERISQSVTWEGESYSIVTGWKITDEAGLVSFYGDYADNPSAPARNATQHELSWPKGPGLVGYAVQGDVQLHPVAWNLRRQEDLEGNWLEYDYLQTTEKLAVSSWTSKYGFTKECYLQKVRSSMGSSVTFILDDKGQGEFSGEYWDGQGEPEVMGSDPDGFVDPLERKYLQAIEVRGVDGKKTGRIDLCYKPLQIEPGGKKLPGFTKRLLVSVIHSNAEGLEMDREEYSYYTDAARASASTTAGKLKEPLGALYQIKGPNCGTVEYKYSNQALGGTGVYAHAQKINIGPVYIGKDPKLGVLGDGTQFIVEAANSNTSAELHIYGLVGGSWLPMDYGLNGQWTSMFGLHSILMGEKDWFAIVESGTGAYEGMRNLIPVVWNSKKWVAQAIVKGNGSREAVWAGPDYLVHSRTNNHKITLTIPWTRWGKKYSYTIDNVDDSNFDRTQLQIEAGKNHIVVSYIRNDFAPGNSRALVVLSFKGDALQETYFEKDLDNDSKYFLGGNYFFGLEEAKGLSGFFSSAWHWKGDGWKKTLGRSTLNGVQGGLELMARGSDYYLVRHNDEDDMSVFDWDGDNWSRPYKNKNMVDNDDFDLFVESNWHAEGGNSFFNVLHPRNIWQTKRVCWLARPKRWGMKCVKHVDVPYWQSTYPDARLTRFEKREEEWSNTDETTLGCPETEKNILTGQDWYIETACAKKAWIWNDREWHEEALPSDVLTGATSLGSGIFYKTDDKNGILSLYRKLDDSFINSFGAYVVTRKIVSDPVTDQNHEYAYSFVFAKQETGYAFDGPNNTPLVESVSISLPAEAGSLKQTLCVVADAKNDIRLAMGQVCKEEKYDSKGTLTGWSKNKYQRHRESAWPTPIFVDRLVSTEGVAGGLKNKTSIEYNYALNGMVSQSTQLSGNKQSVTRTLYAAEKYAPLLARNRLTEVAASYACLPDCSDKGKISSASAVRYGTTSGNTVPYAFETWNWEPASIQSASSFSFDWNSATQSSKWQKTQSTTRFAWGRAIESKDRLGRKTAVFYENNAMGLNFGQVVGSGIDESVLLSGQSCEIQNVKQCSTVELSGNATEGSGTDFGRFSNMALLLTGSSPLVATLPSGLGAKYRFSAWVQGVDQVNETLQLVLGGQVVQQWILSGADAGKWKQVEWEGALAKGSQEMILRIGQGSARVQDIRLLPFSASASVQFWDRHWGVVTAQSDDHALGRYSKLDAAGRVVERYAEDVQGNVVLSARTTYVNNGCKDNSQGAGTIARLKINGVSVPLSSVGGEQAFVLTGGEAEFEATWSVAQNGDHVRYKLYPAGQEASAEWISACCADIESAVGDATVQTAWILKLDVEPYSASAGAADYTVHIQRDATGWTDHGGPLGSGAGSLGRYLGNQTSGRIGFVSHAGGMKLSEAVFDGNSWVTSVVEAGVTDEFLGVSSGASRYLVNLPAAADEDGSTEHAKGMANLGNAWSSLGSLTEQKGVDQLRIALDGQSRPWALYRSSGSNGGLQAVRWNSTLSKWENAGSLPVFSQVDAEPTDFIAGRVSERIPSDADIVWGADGHMYVAYIGSIASLGNASAAPRAVVLKRLYSAEESRVDKEIWAGASQIEEEDALIPGVMPDYAGDVLELDGQILIGAKRIRLASDGASLYLAVAYSVAGKTPVTQAVTVFKGTWKSQVAEEDGVVFRSKLEFQPLIDNSITASSLGATVEEEQKRPFYLSPSDPFDFVVRQGVPYLSFVNSANRQYASVIRYTGSRWTSIGNPAFAFVAQGLDQLDLSVAGDEEPYVVYKEAANSTNSKRRNRVVPLKYVKQGDRDLSLTSVRFGGVATSLAAEFRQYILNYSATVDAAVSSFQLTATPKTLADIVGIQIERNGVLVGSWVVDPASAEAKKYLSGVAATFKGSTVPAFAIPLSEGLNKVSVKLIGKNGKQLQYAFELAREFLPDPEVSVSGAKLEGPIDTSGNGQIVYVHKGDAELTFCISFLTGWTLTVSGVDYTSNSCFVWNPKTDSVWTGTLSDGDGNTREIIIKNTLPGTGGASGSGGAGSNSVLPQVLVPFAEYGLLAGENLILADRVSVVQGTIAAGKKVELGVEAKIAVGDLVSGGNVWLRNRANVQKIVLAGTLDTQDGASYTAVEKKDVVLPSLVALTVSPGEGDFYVANDQTTSISPGSYKDFHVYSRSVVHFAPGDYYFSSFVLEPDVKLEFGTSDTGVRIWVQGVLSLADRVNLENLGTPEKLLLYTNGTGTVRLGVGNQLRAVVVAPVGSVEVPSGIIFAGHIWAKNLNVQPDVSFE